MDSFPGGFHPQFQLKSIHFSPEIDPASGVHFPKAGLNNIPFGQMYPAGGVKFDLNKYQSGIKNPVKFGGGLFPGGFHPQFHLKSIHFSTEIDPASGVNFRPC
ncbi:MAG: hypothetical protein DWQ02_18145 [Bacteroidetes bacterium]|nr:MAG: hypothetical protein DWQ02_18145 [Bacteroidota bacterium]